MNRKFPVSPVSSSFPRVWKPRSGRARVSLLCGAALVLGVASWHSVQANNLTFVVNSTADTPDATPGDGICGVSNGPCTLRAAIQETNAQSGPDTINFSIPDGGVKTISIASALPAISSPVVIDGATQPGFNASTRMPLIELTFASSPGNGNGLLITGGNSTVRSLIITNFGEGIRLETGGGNTIQGCFIGTDFTGTLARPNLLDGIQITNSSNNLIGGTTLAARNLLSGNTGASGLEISGASNTVQGNLIGTDITGTKALPNASGIVVSNSSNSIGGSTPDARNLVSGNTIAGFIIANNSRFNTVQGNFIGTDAAGNAAIPNKLGIEIRDSPNNTIGGGAQGQGNVISGNSGDGILINGVTAGDNQVSGNLIGRNALNTGALGNTGSGVLLRGSGPGTIIGGGVSPGNANTIAHNGGAGVAVVFANGACIRKGITENSIFSNGGLGIDLENDGVTPNDALDADTGANEKQNFPTIGSATTTTVSGTLDSQANTAYRLEFFASDASDPSGFGEGQRYIGEANVTTNAQGTVNFTFKPATALTPGQFISATAMDPQQNTSEFSGSVVVAAESACSTVVTNINDAGNGSLRSAINCSNVTAGTQTISFAISGAGVQTIAPTSPLPAITDAAMVDGTTQPTATANTLATGGLNAKLLIELNGQNAGTDANGLVITAPSTVVRGLVINRFLNGIVVNGATGTTVAGCFIGTDTAGTTARPNRSSGIFMDGATGAAIGGSVSEARNLIAGNAGAGVVLTDGSNLNSVQGNLIGTDATGNGALGNGLNGIVLNLSGANTIGGAQVGAGNVVSANGFATSLNSAIYVINAPDGIAANTIQGNTVGLNAPGSAILGNNGIGVDIFGSNGTLVGGATAAAGNLISGNLYQGIILAGGTSNTTVQNNRIGLSAAGAPTFGNAREGILVQSANFEAEATVVGANRNSNGLVPSAIINGTGNRITQNSIAGNGRLGIDLGGANLLGDGSTANDALDPDIIPNNGQNFPIITGVNGNVVSGTLNSYPNEDFRIEVFASDAADPSGFGEGQTFLGAVDDLVTDAEGNVNWTFTSPTALAGKSLSATAIYIEEGGGEGGGGLARDGDTSEFSPVFAVRAAPATLSIADLRITEGNSGTTSATFTVSLSTASTQRVTVNFATANGTAAQPGDYTRTSGALTFSPGQTRKTLKIPVVGDTLDEPDETFKVNLSGASGAAISDGQALGTILDNDPTPTASINNVRIAEGNAGTRNANFTVSLSNPSTSAQTIAFSTADGTATAGSDYTATSGTLIIAAGKTKGTIPVPIVGDTAVEGNETFVVNISSGLLEQTTARRANAVIGGAQGTGTITNDDAPSVPPTFAIGDASVTEGNSGTQTAVFTVTRSVTTGTAVSVQFATADATATAGSDYTATAGTLSFAAGQTTRTISVPVVGDTAREADETFTLTLSGPSPSNAPLSRAQGIGTLVNDDTSSDLQITQTVTPNPVSVGGQANFTLQVRNGGPDASQGVVVTNTLPAGTTFLSAAGAPSTQSGQVITFTLGSLENGASTTLTVSVRAPDTPGSLTNSASVSGVGAPDSNASNNNSTANEQVIAGPQNVTGSVQINLGNLIRVGPYVPGLYRPGARFVQNVTIRNTSASAIGGPVSLVLDGLPADVELTNRSGMTALTPAGQAFITLDVGSDGVLSPGEQKSVRLEFLLRGSTRPGFTARVVAGPGAP